ncbi:MAG: FAD-dependent oxidoreductase, partial [Haloechinothrix sp.]
PYLTNEKVLEQTDLPDSLVVLDGGTVGCELAQAFGRLVSKVTVVRPGERLLSGEEPAASATVADVFAREGIETHPGATVETSKHGPAHPPRRNTAPSRPGAGRNRARPGDRRSDLEAAGVRTGERGYSAPTVFSRPPRRGSMPPETRWAGGS